MDKINRIRPRNRLYESFVAAEALVIVAVCCLLIKPLTNGLLVGCGLYLALANALRGVFLQHHRRGIRHMGNRRFAEAIGHFSLSLAFFAKHTGIDKCRYVTMFATSQLSYGQMALFNLANCYAGEGRFREAKGAMEQFLQTGPPDTIAQETLSMIARIDEIMAHDA